MDIWTVWTPSEENAPEWTNNAAGYRRKRTFVHSAANDGFEPILLKNNVLRAQKEGR
jgi:hypothetical protein